MSNFQRNRQDARPGFSLTDEQRKGILECRGDMIADTAEKLAESIRDLSSSQIRNFYGTVVQIKSFSRTPEAQLNELHILRPKLSYMKARDKNAQNLEHSFSSLIRSATADKRQLEGIFNFAEAVVAYHKGLSAKKGG